jgi:hypothetical protein
MITAYSYSICVGWYYCHTPKVLFGGLIAELRFLNLRESNRQMSVKLPASSYWNPRWVSNHDHVGKRNLPRV